MTDLFSPTQLGRLTLPNRIVRSATFEGMATSDGAPELELGVLYAGLVEGGCGMITTGFAFVSEEGRAMHPGQCGIHTDAMIKPWATVVETAKLAGNVPLVLQIAHAGRQTAGRSKAIGAGPRRCTYFRRRVQPMNRNDILRVAADFGRAALRAKLAGFDGVQLHAAHGYLLHQFLSPWTNDRTDEWRDGNRFVELVVNTVRERCGDFPVLVKLSWADDNQPGIRREDSLETVKRLEALRVAGIEVSYGTMEYALNIIRGGFPVERVLAVNPLFNRIPKPLLGMWKIFRLPRYRRMFKPFSPNYNVEAAARIRSETSLPVYPVGGIRTLASLEQCAKTFPAVAVCRPLIHDPAWPRALKEGRCTTSGCTNCNHCTVMVDGAGTLRCHSKHQ